MIRALLATAVLLLGAAASAASLPGATVYWCEGWSGEEMLPRSSIMFEPVPITLVEEAYASAWGAVEQVCWESEDLPGVLADEQWGCRARALPGGGLVYAGVPADDPAEARGEAYGAWAAHQLRVDPASIACAVLH